MEKFKKTYPSKPLAWAKDQQWALAGVVGSGNLEVLIEHVFDSTDLASFAVETSIPGFKKSWLAALKDFSALYALGGSSITIHDQGAEPIVVMLRLRQALDQIKKAKS